MTVPLGGLPSVPSPTSAPRSPYGDRYRKSYGIMNQKGPLIYHYLMRFEREQHRLATFFRPSIHQAPTPPLPPSCSFSPPPLLLPFPPLLLRIPSFPTPLSHPVLRLPPSITPPPPRLLFFPLSLSPPSPSPLPTPPSSRNTAAAASHRSLYFLPFAPHEVRCATCNMY